MNKLLDKHYRLKSFKFTIKEKWDAYITFYDLKFFDYGDVGMITNRRK